MALYSYIYGYVQSSIRCVVMKVTVARRTKFRLSVGICNDFRLPAVIITVIFSFLRWRVLFFLVVVVTFRLFTNINVNEVGKRGQVMFVPSVEVSP